MIFESEIEAYKSILPECDVIFDVGCREDAIFHRLKPDAEIHLFDPMFSSNMARLPNYNNFALGNVTAVMAFYPRYGSFIKRTDEPKFDKLHFKSSAKMDTVQNYCSQKDIKRIDLLKIDAEGCDFEVIKGVGDVPVRYIIFEDFDTYIGGERIEDVFEYIDAKYPNNERCSIGGKPENFMIKTNEHKQ